MFTKGTRFYVLVILSLCLVMSTAYYADASEKLSSDKEILQSIQEVLSKYDTSLQSQFEITVDHGIVSLIGIFNTLNSRKKMVECIKKVAGVKGIVNYSLLQHIIRRDKDIKDEIIVAFLHSPSIFEPDITISVSNQKVTLSGSVANQWEKEEAVNIASAIPGVLAVRNHIVVDPRIPRSPITLKEEIEEMLSSDPYLFDSNITVKSSKDKLLLQGDMKAPEKKMELSKKIEEFNSEDIENTLQTDKIEVGFVQERGLDFGDPNTQKIINDMIQTDERIDPFIMGKLKISIKDGIVTLWGTVDDIYQKRFLKEDILNMIGVKAVEDHLVAKKRIRKDEDIIRDIKRAFKSNANLRRASISIRSDSGNVILEGKIEDPAEEVEAKVIAKSIDGVKKVVDNLTRKDAYESSSLPDLIRWNMEIEQRTFQVSVDQQHENIIIQGYVESAAQKDRVEKAVKMRAPKDFFIINEINIKNR